MTLNWQQLKTILWLRWRLQVNQYKRAGAIDAVVSVIFLVIGLLIAVTACFAAFFAGIVVLPNASPTQILYIWDVIIFAFMIFWIVGLISELQLGEGLSLRNLLHLPISLNGTFLLNYLASLINLTLIMFVPAMLGLSAALVIAKGPAMLIMFPLVAAFILMITAVTYQFRSWLASLMANKRRRRALMVYITMGLVALSQLPMLFTFGNLRSLLSPEVQAEEQQYMDELSELSRAYTAKEITGDEFVRQYQSVSLKRDSARDQLSINTKGVLVMANKVLPPGWLAYGAMALARHNIWPGLLAALGGFLIAGASLCRSYRTTLRLYRGAFQGRRAERQSARLPAARTGPPSLVEKQLPWISEQSAGIALANLRSLMRAPEIKMILVLPFIIIGSISFVLFSFNTINVLPQLRPLIPLIAIFLSVIVLGNLTNNIFAWDRDGFRLYVLSPVPGRAVLFGKNLAAAPLVLGITGCMLLVLQFSLPIAPTYFLAMLLQAACVYLIFCLLGNMMSILAPFAVASGTFRPGKPQIQTILKHVAVSLLSPIVVLPGFALYGIDFLVARFIVAGIPCFLILTVMHLAVVLFIYSRSLEYQGRLLQRRQQKILEVVTATTGE